MSGTSAAAHADDFATTNIPSQPPPAEREPHGPVSAGIKHGDKPEPVYEDSTDLTDAHEDHLVNVRGLEVADIERAGLFDRESGPYRWPAWARGSGIAIPYPRLPHGILRGSFVCKRVDGQPGVETVLVDDAISHEFIKVRYDDQVIKADGNRYQGPPDQPSRLYIPWYICPEVYSDPLKPLIITEGEFKALLLALRGHAAVSIPGVTGSHDPHATAMAALNEPKAVELREGLDALLLPGRRVIICFDSPDMLGDKPQVIAAAVRLCAALVQAHPDKAQVDIRIAYVPQLKFGTKAGIDDYLLLLERPREVECLPPNFETGFATVPLRVAEPRTALKGYKENLKYCLKKGIPASDTMHSELGQLVVWAAVWYAGNPNGWKRFLNECRASPSVEEDVEEVVRIRLRDFHKYQPSLRPVQDPREYVQAWLSNSDVTYRDGMLFHGREVRTPAVLETKLMLDSQEDKTGIKDTNLKWAFSEWFEDQPLVALRKVRVELAHSPDADRRQLLAFVRAVTGGEDPLDVAAIEHFVWQVQRKLNDLPVFDHLMPILYGEKRAGKSEAVKKLLAPLDTLVDAAADLSVFSDERSLFRLTRSYIMFFDEMAKAQRADLPMLKNIISAPTVSWRELGNNRKAKGPNVATFIGTTNDDVQDIIVDPTGMRRFYQVACQSHMDWEAINSIDYPQLWRCVDPNAEAPIKAQLEALGAHQEKLRARDIIEDWLETRCESIGTAEKWTAAAVAYESFCQFSDQLRRGIPKATQAVFGRKLKVLLARRLGEGKGWRESHGIKYDLTLKPTVSATMDTKVDEYRSKGVQASMPSPARA